ncbi:MAG: hypothetical protein J7M25_02360 [Deltaproteobacteria bacterium]|nr:hypothetical protein [Deltaproteobacteria bacterium]
MESPEGCDDGNLQDGDGCSAACSVEPGWSCSSEPSSCKTTCGDGIRAGQESCDGTELGDNTCETAGFVSGQLTCRAQCTLDDSECAVCGNGTCEYLRSETIDNCPADCAFVQLAVGFKSSCAVRTDGTVWCWGLNDNGQLGNPDVPETTAVPAKVVGSSFALQVDVGGHCACALVEAADSSREVWCWGKNQSGQLGNSQFESQATPTKVPVTGNIEQVELSWQTAYARMAGHEVIGWGAGRWHELGCSVHDTPHETPESMTWPEEIDALSCDGGACCVRLADTHELSCWGQNQQGELGNGTLDGTCVPAVVYGMATTASFNMGDHYACSIDPTGGLWCWGNNDRDQIDSGLGEDVLIPKAIANIQPLDNIWLGWHHTCGVTTTHAALCWGDNEYGQLGNGLTNPAPQPPIIPSGLEKGVITAQAGRQHSCALLENGHVVCWGDNSDGELGNGSFDPSTRPVPVLFP